MCKDLYGKVDENVKQLIENFHYVVYFYIWSDPRSNASLLSLTRQGISENFERLSIIPNCKIFDDHHIDNLIAKKFDKMLFKLNIQKYQVHSLTWDEGFNMKRDARIAGFSDVDCTVHKLQLPTRSCFHSQENIMTVKQKWKKRLILTIPYRSEIHIKFQVRLKQAHL